jgi:hypothetical protein
MGDEKFSVGSEGRQFLRHVMPGLVYGVEVLLFLSIALPDFTAKFLVDSSKDALGAIAGVFLASGGLGYIFSSVHHWRLWRCEPDIFDHRPVIRKLRDMGKVEINATDVMELDGKDPLKARTTAQILSLGIWYQLDTQQRVYDQLRLLGNQAHGLGAAYIASIFAILTSVFVVLTSEVSCRQTGIPMLDTLSEVNFWSRFLLIIILGWFFCCIFKKGLKRVAMFAQRIYDNCLIDKSQDKFWRYL